MCPARMYYRIHSVLGELSYTKGKVHKNSICHCRPGKGNLMATCPAHFLTSRYYRKFQFFPSDSDLTSTCINCISVHDDISKYCVVKLLEIFTMTNKITTTNGLNNNTCFCNNLETDPVSS